jgi:hypothetical protein
LKPQVDLALDLGVCFFGVLFLSSSLLFVVVVVVVVVSAFLGEASEKRFR